jgi:hypothetical protein
MLLEGPLVHWLLIAAIALAVGALGIERRAMRWMVAAGFAIAMFLAVWWASHSESFGPILPSPLAAAGLALVASIGLSPSRSTAVMVVIGLGAWACWQQARGLFPAMPTIDCFLMSALHMVCDGMAGLGLAGGWVAARFGHLSEAKAWPWRWMQAVAQGGVMVLSGLLAGAYFRSVPVWGYALLPMVVGVAGLLASVVIWRASVRAVVEIEQRKPTTSWWVQLLLAYTTAALALAALPMLLAGAV